MLSEMNYTDLLKNMQELHSLGFVNDSQLIHLQILCDYNLLRKPRKTESDHQVINHKFKIPAGAVLTVAMIEEMLGTYYCYSPDTIHRIVYLFNKRFKKLKHQQALT
jgi:hypothetical protein